MDWQIGIFEGGGWNAIFWCNHDQPRVVSRFGDDSTEENRQQVLKCWQSHYTCCKEHLISIKVKKLA